MFLKVSGSRVNISMQQAFCIQIQIMELIIMKRAIVSAILTVVLGFSTIADARHFGRGTGIVGTVTAVSAKSFTVSVLSSGTTKTYKVKFGHGTKVTGPSAHAIDSSLVGHSVSIVGSGSGSTIKAKEVVVAS
jgi:hypothetical protein